MTILILYIRNFPGFQWMMAPGWTQFMTVPVTPIGSVFQCLTDTVTGSIVTDTTG